MAAEDVVVTVTSDTSGFSQGMRDAAQATVSAGKQMSDSMGDVKEHVAEAAAALAKLTIGAVTIEKVFELGKASLETAENVERMSQSLGFSIQTVQLLGYTAALTGGGGLESMRGSLARLDRAASEASTGNKTVLAGFQALGIGSTQLAQLMKNPDEMLRTVVTRLSDLNNGANKTNIAMTLMGRGAAEQIPMINKLGEEWDKLKQHAEAIGVVLSDKDVKALAQTEDQMNDLGQQIHGVANQIMIGLLPALNAIGGILTKVLQSGEVKEFFTELSTDIAQYVTIGERVWSSAGDGIKKIKDAWNDYWGTADVKPRQVFSDIAAGLQSDMDAWERMKGSAQKAWILIQEGGDILWNALKRGFADFITFMAQGFDKFSGLGFLSDKLGLPKFSDEVKQMTAGLSASRTNMGQYVQALSDVDKKVAEGITANATWVKGLRDQAAAQRDLNQAIDQHKKDAPGIANPEALAQQEKAAEAYQHLVDMQAKYATQTSDLVAKADAQLIVDFKEINAAADKAIKLGYDRVQVENAVIAVTNAAYDANQRRKEQIEKELDITGNMIQKLKEERDSVGLTGEALFIYQKVVEAVNQAKQKNIDLSPQQVQAIENEAAATFEAKDAWDKYKQEVDAVQGAVSGYLNHLDDDFAKVLTGQKDAVKNFKQDVVGDFKDMVAQMISAWMKLNILGPILQGLFGGGGSGAAMSMAGNALFGGGLTTGAFSGGASGVMSASGATFMGGSSGSGNGWAGNIGSGYQAYQMMNNGGISGMWGGAQNAYSNFMYGNGAGYGSNFMGSFENMAGNNVWTPSGLGMGVGIAGGLYAGYNRYQDRYNTGTGLAAGAAYGVGTYAAAAGLGSLAAGGGAAAGVAGGMSAIGMVPVIGWIALAAMVVDMVTKGGLFGTAAKFNGGSENINIGAGGADMTTVLDLKGKKPLFQGSYHKAQDVANDPEAEAALKAWFDALTKQLGQIGTTYGVKAGDVIDAAFTQTFDKHGNIKTHTSSVMGDTFNEDQSHFLERVQSLSIAGTLDKLGIDVTAYIQQFKQNADDMATAVQDAMAFLGEAKKNVDDGIGLLTGQNTLKDIWSFVLGAQQAGESLSQTYQRLEQATAQYRSVMQNVNTQLQQLWAGTDPGRQFGVTIENIDKQTTQTIQSLNDAARAAGLQGAKEEDLARVHSLAAAQAAAAMQQLQNAGLSLVDQLYGTGTIQGQIDAIENRANSGASAIKSFSDAMGQAAAAAQAAAQLMVGDLSPLNDQQKLQYAIQQYQQGALNKDDVLQIGRRLYGTSQPYNDLFSELQGMRGGIHNASGGSSGGGMSAADTARVNQLKAEQAQQQRAQEAQQLASVVATMMAAQGKSATDIADELHFKMQDLAKDLNMSQKELNDYLAKLETNNTAVPDSITSNTDRLIDVLERLLDPNYQAQPIVDAVNDTGHSTHQAIQRNTEAVDTNTDAVANSGSGGNRSSRGLNRN